MAFDEARGVTVLFGGLRANFRPGSDTWIWNGERWINPMASCPSARSWHILTYDAARRTVVLVGGRDSAGRALADTCEWDGVRWRERSNGPLPARDHHAATYDARNGLVIVHGGFDGSRVYADTWGWNGSSWLLVAPPGRRGPGSPGSACDRL